MAKEESVRLNQKQIGLLHLIYRFRFVTTELVALYQGDKKPKTVYPRLQYLLEKGYIGRRYEPSYKLSHKRASYFLLPDGLRILRKQPRDDYTYNEQQLNNIRKDKTANDQFIDKNLDILFAYCQLKAQYGDNLQFFTKSDLRDYSGSIQPLPDAYIRLEIEGEVKQFILDTHYEQPPFFLAIRRLKQYTEYAETKQGAKVPHILALCDTSSMQRRLANKMAKQTHPNLNFLLTTKETLAKIGDSLNVWRRPASEDELVSLETA